MTYLHSEETTIYTKEQIQTILLFLNNDLDWYNNRYNEELDEEQSILIATYLKERIKDCQEEI